MQRIKAKIKRVTDRGFGFLSAPDFRKDIFFHFSKLRGSGLEESDLRQGDEIEVEIREGDRGWEVTKVIGAQGGSSNTNRSNTSSRHSQPRHRGSVQLISRQTKESAENFYIHLQKRIRFRLRSEKDKKGRETAKQFEIYKINHGEDNWSGVLSKCNYTAINTRHLANANKISNGLRIAPLTPEHRMIVGLGGGSVYETSITLHHTYGFPYIPASAIKGIIRSYLINSLWGTKASSEDEAFEESKAMCDIFGTPEKGSFYARTFKEDEKQFGKDISKYRYGIKGKAGDLIFFDAYPLSAPQVVSDIMNPHYPDYYGDNTNTVPPADWQSPKPILFLTVEATTFQFMVGLKRGKAAFDLKFKSNEETKYDGAVLEEIERIIKDALDHQGIGAKTAVGYGYMQ